MGYWQDPTQGRARIMKQKEKLPMSDDEKEKYEKNLFAEMAPWQKEEKDDAMKMESMKKEMLSQCRKKQYAMYVDACEESCAKFDKIEWDDQLRGWDMWRDDFVKTLFGSQFLKFTKTGQKEIQNWVMEYFEKHVFSKEAKTP